MPKSRGRKPKKKRAPASAPKKRLDNFNTTPQELPLSTQPPQEPPLATAPRQEQPTPNQEEALFESTRPILLNGIEEVVSRPDLGDRAIFLTLPPIGDAQRRPETELWREFEIAQPRILGALLDAAV